MSAKQKKGETIKMLPKVNKNIFGIKTAQKKKFNFKLLVASIIFAGTAGYANTHIPTSPTMESLQQIKQNTIEQKELTLKPSEKSQKLYAWHYSHRSHYSHSSHRSHYSHYSSYY